MVGYASTCKCVCKIASLIHTLKKGPDGAKHLNSCEMSGLLVDVSWIQKLRALLDWGLAVVLSGKFSSLHPRCVAYSKGTRTKVGQTCIFPPIFILI